jgi:DNA-binding response OmpR family regulator
MANILICDDERDIVSALKIYLSGEGYDLFEAHTGLEALEVVRRHPIHLILMDIMMPEMDGISATAKLREEYNIPIILLTAKMEDMDKLMGFDHGADDYLTKPFNILELKARIRALLRRANRSEKKAAPAAQLTIGSISLDLDARNAYKNGTLADLTAKEFDVIEFLMRNPNRVYSREALLDTIWAYEYRSDIRTVDVQIRRLREKLEENPAEPKYILTKWGVGYYFKK